VKDEQLTISGIPAPGFGSARGQRPLRSNSRRRAVSHDVTPELPRRGGADLDVARIADTDDRPPPNASDVYDLGVRTDLVTACRIALGVGSTTAYALAGRGELPFPAYRVGRQWVVPTAGLLTFLGLPAQKPGP
jgi:hypothetical protein